MTPAHRFQLTTTRRTVAAMLMLAAPAFSGCRTGVTDTAQPATTRNALQAHAWKCSDGNTINSRNLSSPPAIALRIGTQTRTLPQVRAASGVRYEDAAMQFWTKGDTATFERKPDKPVECREIRSQSLLEDARVRGVTFRGTGNEPGWLLEIGPDNRVLFEDGYGSMRVVFQSLPPRGTAQRGETVYENTSSAQRLKITLRQKPCADTMSDETFPYTVDVEVEGARRQGCGRSLQQQSP